MRHAIPTTFVLATMLASFTGARAQETNRAPVQSRRATQAEADDRPRLPAPGEPGPRDRPPVPPAPGNVPTLPEAPLQPPTTPALSWQPPLPSTTPPLGTPAPAWQPTPPVSAPQPMMPPGPGPQQPGRYTLFDRELSVLDAEGDSTSLGPVTLLFDSATGEVSYLVREGGSLTWRVVPRPPMPPHHPPAGHPVGPWTQPPHLTPPSLPPANVTNPLVDTAGFRESVSEADRLRVERRVGEAAFLALATPESVILDCRSRDAFARLHVRGAVNLPFPDITAGELARLIPSPETRVLLYCNNNFAAAPTAFPEKVARAALNHHSFATLVAYGYRNVFELAPLVDVAATEIPLEGDDAP